jgi:hypothetical protein
VMFFEHAAECEKKGIKDCWRGPIPAVPG